MPELLPREELRAEHLAMEACPQCKQIHAATGALHDLLQARLMLLAEWGDASHQIYYAEQRHLAAEHPRYYDHIAAVAADQERTSA